MEGILAKIFKNKYYRWDDEKRRVLNEQSDESV